MKFFLCLMMTTLLLLMSCSEVKEVDKNESSSIVISRIEKEASVEEVKEGKKVYVFKMKACLTEVVREQSFSKYNIEVNGEKKTTDIDGCFLWTERVTDNPRYRESFVPREPLIIKSEYGELVQDFSLNYKGEVIREKTQPLESVEKENYKSLEAQFSEEDHRLVVKEVSFEKRGDKENSYKINDYLELNFTKKYYASFDLLLDERRPHEKFTKVCSGKFEIETFFLAHAQDKINLKELENNLISIPQEKKIIDIENCRANIDLELDISFFDMPYVTSRSKLIFKISPVENSIYEDVIPALSYGYFTLAKNKFTSKQRNLSKDIEELNETISILPSSRSVLPKAPARDSQEIFLNANNKLKGFNKIDVVRLSDFKSKVGHSLDLKSFNSVFDEKPSNDILKKFCSYFFPESHWKKDRTMGAGRRCLRKPAEMMGFKSLRFISKTTGNVEKVKGYSESLSLGAGMFVFSGDRKTQGTSHAVEASISSSGIPILNKTGLGIGYSYSGYWSKDSYVGGSDRESIATSKNFSVEAKEFRFNAYGKRCVLVVGLPYEAYKDKDKLTELDVKLDEPYRSSYMYGGPVYSPSNRQYVRTISPKRLMLCGDSDKKEQLLEKWFFIKESVLSNADFRDVESESEAPIMFLIRGKDNFLRTKEKLMNDQIDIFLERKKMKLSDRNFVERIKSMSVLDRYNLPDGSYPGVYGY